MGLMCIFFAILFVASQTQNCCALSWGCNFKNFDKFILGQEALRESPIVYGEDVPAAVMSDWNELKQLLGKIQIILQAVVSVSQYNSIHNIVKFYKNNLRKLGTNGTFEAVNLNEFIDFYYNYEPKFSEETAINGQVVKVLRRFLEENSQYTDNVFLATVYADAPVEYGKSQQYLFDVDNATFIHNHVAAILKIRFNKVDGFVVMDPVRGITKPVLVMGTDYRFNTEKTRDNIYFRMLPSYAQDEYGKIILYPPYMIQSHNIRGRRHSTNHLYYVRHPFCSMMYTTYKRDLLNPIRILGIRDEDGKFIAKFTFNLMQEESEYGPSFTLWTRGQPMVVHFNHLQLKQTRQGMDAELVKADVPGLLYPHAGVYKQELRKIGHVFKDTPFIRLYKAILIVPA